MFVVAPVRQLVLVAPGSAVDPPLVLARCPHLLSPVKDTPDEKQKHVIHDLHATAEGPACMQIRKRNTEKNVRKKKKKVQYDKSDK